MMRLQPPFIPPFIPPSPPLAKHTPIPPRGVNAPLKVRTPSKVRNRSRNGPPALLAGIALGALSGVWDDQPRRRFGGLRCPR